MNLSLLIIDDDQKLFGLLKTYMARFGHALTGASTAREGLRLLKQEPPDLLILDLMLPDQDGLTLCKQIRSESDLPIIMLTARGDLPDRVLGLELGADDYLAKPFEPRELVARIERICQRAASRTDKPQVVGDLVLDPHCRSVRLKGEDLELSGAEFDLLAHLMASRKRAFSREQLLLKLKGIHVESSERALDMLISRLRSKLGDDPRCPRFIKTIRGIGYQFIGTDHGA